jgi:hypothetical protein
VCSQTRYGENQMATDLNLTPLLLEALSSRSGSPVNPALQALLTGTTTTETADVQGIAGALPSAQELLSQLESTNPTLGLVARYLTARQAAASEEATEAGSEMEHEYEEHADEDQRLAQMIQRLEQQVSKLCAEREHLRAHNDACAAALGACYLCWGEDTHCPVCHGAGRPGYALPDRQLLSQLVAPAWRRLQAQHEVKQRDSKHKQSNGSVQSVQPVMIQKGVENE